MIQDFYLKAESSITLDHRSNGIFIDVYFDPRDVIENIDPRVIYQQRGEEVLTEFTSDELKDELERRGNFNP